MPAYYPAQPSAPVTPRDRRATWALVAVIAGVAFGLLGLLAGAVVLLFANGDLAAAFALDAPEINPFLLGVPALALGPAGYFLAKAAGGPNATASAFIGIGVTVLGAVSTLLWLVILLLGYFGPPPA